MSSVNKLAGAAGSIDLTTRTTAGQLITPVSVPTVKWYTDTARTAGEVTLTVTGSGSAYVASWTAAQAPASPATRYLKITIEVSAGVTDPDADDEISFLDAAAFVGTGYVTVAEVRALAHLGDTAKFTDTAIASAIDWFETRFERYTGVAWVPRTVTDERHYLTSADSLRLNNLFPRSISAVRSYTTASASTAYSATELADLHLDPSGVVRRVSLGRFTSSWGLLAVDYTHSATLSPPADVKDACLTAVASKLLADRSGRQPYLVAQEGLVSRFSRPGPDRPFGIDEVDTVANDRSHRTPAVA